MTVHPLFRKIISNVAPALDAPHPTRRADGRTPNPLVAETALLNDVLSSPPEKFGRLSDGELFADAFDGGCPADVSGGDNASNICKCHPRTGAYTTTGGLTQCSACHKWAGHRVNHKPAIDPTKGGNADSPTSDPAHGGRGGTMGDAAAAKRGFTAEQDRAASTKAGKALLESLKKRIDKGELRDLHEISNLIELGTMLIK